MTRLLRLPLAALLLAFTLLTACGAGGAGGATGMLLPAADVPNPAYRFSGERALAHAASILERGPRYAAVPGHAAVISYLEQTLAGQGMSVRRVPFTSSAQGLAGLSFTNVIAHAQEPTGPVLLFGAHFDSLPESPMDPDPAKRRIPLVGANDNAGGVGALLELSRALAERGLTSRIAFVFLDAEERVFTRAAMFAGAKDLVARRDELFPLGIEAFVLLDMVGDSDLVLRREGYSRSHSPALLDAIFAAARRAGSTAFQDGNGPTVLDDHIPFQDAGIPAVDLIDFDYPPWHTTADTLDKISAASLGQVGRALEQFAMER